MSRGGATGLVTPTREEALRIWDTIVQNNENTKESNFWSGTKKLGRSVVDNGVVCDMSSPLVHALFIQAYYFKFGYLPNFGREQLLKLRGPGCKEYIKKFAKTLFDFEEKLLDFLNYRLYLEGHTFKMCSEINPPLVGQDSDDVPLVTRFTRMGVTSCTFPSSLELIDLVGNVIRHGVDYELEKKDAKDTSYTNYSRGAELLSLGRAPVVFVSRFSIQRKARGGGGVSNANRGFSCFIGPDATVAGLHSDRSPYVPRIQRELAKDAYEEFFEKHRAYNQIKSQNTPGVLLRETNPAAAKNQQKISPYQQDMTRQQKAEALIPVGFFDMGASDSVFASPSRIVVSLVPVRDALIEYYEGERSKNTGNLS